MEKEDEKEWKLAVENSTKYVIKKENGTTEYKVNNREMMSWFVGSEAVAYLRTLKFAGKPTS